MALRGNLEHFLTVLEQAPQLLCIEVDSSRYINHDVKHGTGEKKDACKESIRLSLSLSQLVNA